MAVVSRFISSFTASATGSVGLVDSARDVVEPPSSSSSLTSSGGAGSRRNVRFEYSESGTYGPLKSRRCSSVCKMRVPIRA
eukprot:956386-Pleurochrysis_carterae.AAC.2